jgi:aminopeptidase YwaD
MILPTLARGLRAGERLFRRLFAIPFCVTIGAIALCSVRPVGHAVLTEPDESRLMARVDALSGQIGSRPTGSPAEQEAIDYLTAELTSLGYIVEEQPVNTSIRDDGPATVTIGSSEIDGVVLRGSGTAGASGLLADADNPPPGGLSDRLVLANRSADLGGRVASFASEGAAGVIVVNVADSLFVDVITPGASIPVVGVRAGDGDLLRDAAGISATITFPSGSVSATNLIARPDDGSACRTLSGAHYDTVTISPGANDNASGVAVVLELAQLIAESGIRDTASHCSAPKSWDSTGASRSRRVS